jgi:cell division septation protein DedD
MTERVVFTTSTTPTSQQQKPQPAAKVNRPPQNTNSPAAAKPNPTPAAKPNPTPAANPQAAEQKRQE